MFLSVLVDVLMLFLIFVVGPWSLYTIFKRDPDADADAELAELKRRKKILDRDRQIAKLKRELEARTDKP